MGGGGRSSGCSRRRRVRRIASRPRWWRSGSRPWRIWSGASRRHSWAPTRRPAASSSGWASCSRRGWPGWISFATATAGRTACGPSPGTALGVLRDLATEWQIQRQPTWRAALEALAGLIAQQAHRVAGMERRINGSPTPPADGYIGAWVSVRGEPRACLAINCEWGVPELLRVMRYTDIATLERAWERQGVLVPGNGRRRRQFRLPMADGRSIQCPGVGFPAGGGRWVELGAAARG